MKTQTTTYQLESLEIPGFNTRAATRLPMAVTLHLRRPDNSPHYRRPVRTLDISKAGASVACDVALRVGSLLEVFYRGKTFSALATVRHCRRDGKGWRVGLEFLTASGSWIVN